LQKRVSRKGRTPDDQDRLEFRRQRRGGKLGAPIRGIRHHFVKRGRPNLFRGSRGRVNPQKEKKKAERMLPIEEKRRPTALIAESGNQPKLHLQSRLGSEGRKKKGKQRARPVKGSKKKSAPKPC